jgi:hypothetical protein
MAYEKPGYRNQKQEADMPDTDAPDAGPIGVRRAYRRTSHDARRV